MTQEVEREQQYLLDILQQVMPDFSVGRLFLILVKSLADLRTLNSISPTLSYNFIHG